MIVERIRKLLKEKKLSAKDMLIALNINKDSLKRWEASEKEGKPIKEIYLNAVASYLNTTVDYLLGKTDNPASTTVTVASGWDLDEREQTLLTTFRSTTEEGRQLIIQSVLNIRDDIAKRNTNPSQDKAAK